VNRNINRLLRFHFRRFILTTRYISAHHAKIHPFRCFDPSGFRNRSIAVVAVGTTAGTAAAAGIANLDLSYSKNHVGSDFNRLLWLFGFRMDPKGQFRNIRT